MLGFRVCVVMFRVSGFRVSGFRVWGLGLGVGLGLGFRVRVRWFRHLDPNLSNVR